jgi:ATP-dependent Clp protease protease subunit
MKISKIKVGKKISEDKEDLEPDEKTMTTPAPIVKSDGGVRLIGLYGEVEELKVSQLIGALLEIVAQDDQEILELEDEEEPSCYSDNSEVLERNSEDSRKEEAEIEVYEPERPPPIEFVISTPGGNADDMFALYDIMRVVREKCDIVTYGIGKVMSAGVLLLASGTKGQRKIGKNCRVMIHSVVAGSSGSFHSLQNEMSEIKHMQKAYIQALSDETKMSVKYLNTMINRKVNVYLSADEAVKLGIADIIV